MPDLSKTRGRSSRQNRPTTNRSSVLPSRNNTEAPRKQINARVGAATRSDGGAAQLREIFGAVESAAEDFARYTGLTHAERVNSDNAEGLLDEATGEVDEAKVERSRSYRQAVLQQRTEREWLEANEGLDDKVKELIQSQDDPDPAVRETQVRQLLEDHFHSFAFGEGDEMRDFGSPEANRWLAENMAATRGAITSAANQEIENTLNQESIDNSSMALRSRIMAGEDVNIEHAFLPLLPTVDRKAAKSAFIETVIGAAFELNQTDPVRAQKVLRQLEGSSRRTAKETGRDAPTAPTEATEGQEVTALTPLVTMTETSSFGGPRRHNGADFKAPIGTPVKAPLDGEVIASWSGGDGGQQIRVRLVDGSIHGFAHLDDRYYRTGDKVSRGAVLGLTGNSGKSTGPHLHYTVEVEGKKIDPNTYNGQGGNEGEAVDYPTANPKKPTELAEEQLGPLTFTDGGFSLSVPERNRVAESRRALGRQADAQFEREREEKQAEASFEFLDRLHGLGAYPSATEIQEARRLGELSARQASQLLTIIRTDQDRAASQLTRTAESLEAIQVESRRDQANRLANRVVSQVISGHLSVSAAHSEALNLVAETADPEVRASMLARIQAGLTDIRQSRAMSRETQSSIRTAERKRRKIKADIRSEGLRGRALKRAERDIDEMIDQAIIDISSVGVDNGNSEGVASSRLRALDNHILEQYFRQ